MNTLSNLPTIVGLCLALVGPPLIAIIGERLEKAISPRQNQLLCQSALLALLVAVLLIVILGEGLPLSSIGLYPPDWRSLIVGLALAGFFIYVFSPLAFRLLSYFKLGGFESGLAKLAELPVGYWIFAVLVGGVVEEVLYRGYAVERLALMTGSYWVAGMLSVILFGVAHAPLWGWGPALTTFASGSVLTVFYILNQDLMANIIAHVTTDFIGIVVMPLLARMKANSMR